MSKGIFYTGIPSLEELESCPGFPSEERFQLGKVACIECVQEIPCNPCEGACPFGAISIGDKITNLPVLDEDKCVGCGTCVASCPGLAITVIDMLWSDNEALIEFPYEYYPLPHKGELVEAVNRAGETICSGKIMIIRNVGAYAGTTVLGMSIPKKYAKEVRSIKRLPKA